MGATRPMAVVCRSVRSRCSKVENSRVRAEQLAKLYELRSKSGSGQGRRRTSRAERAAPRPQLCRGTSRLGNN